VPFTPERFPRQRRCVPSKSLHRYSFVPRFLRWRSSEGPPKTIAILPPIATIFPFENSRDLSSPLAVAKQPLASGTRPSKILFPLEHLPLFSRVFLPATKTLEIFKAAQLPFPSTARWYAHAPLPISLRSVQTRRTVPRPTWKSSLIFFLLFPDS